jgi:hypothetical protein
VVAQFYATL